MEDKHVFTSDMSINSMDTNIDIRNYMNYDIIKKVLINNPTELALFEIVCIIINNKLLKFIMR